MNMSVLTCLFIRYSLLHLLRQYFTFVTVGIAYKKKTAIHFKNRTTK
uniref:Uncharacterized protein n=1 Tax=Arundo donax TaxID=35708 RepID=A0A0A9FQV0_ARUDO